MVSMEFSSGDCGNDVSQNPDVFQEEPNWASGNMGLSSRLSTESGVSSIEAPRDVARDRRRRRRIVWTDEGALGFSLRLWELVRPGEVTRSMEYCEIGRNWGGRLGPRESFFEPFREGPTLGFLFPWSFICTKIGLGGRTRILEI